MNSVEKALAELKERGFKHTKYRIALLHLLYKTEQPISVQELLHGLSSQGLSPNKTTVYRELYFLIEQKVVVELDLGDDKKRYELAHLDHHHHLICTNCQRIEDVVVDEDLSSVEKKILKDTRFQVTDHTFEFYGLCRDCH